ncbi:ATP-binding protein [Paenibacillus puldeungensis]|uniref:ATP-binding protein n=1 Tax=Paenibacillus puldeungensis TaxID=696536 RepID=A0ABW3RT12_9BACL
MVNGVNLMESDIFQVDKALESWRDSGFDLSTAVGEIVDNSIEARSQIIKIKTFQNQEKNIETIAFADDGVGITPEILAQTLKIGFSTRYNQRKGLGRFGVGMKVAALSQGRRIDIFSKATGQKRYFHAYLDLDLIADGSQTHINSTEVDSLPTEYRGFMRWKDGSEFESGTLIIWSKIDRLVNESTYGNSAKEATQELTKFLARAYRVQLDQGLTIELDEKIIDLYDPLFLIESQRTLKILGAHNFPAEVLDCSEIELDGEKVTITVTLLPESVRRVKGEGGYQRSAAKYKDLYLKDRDGYVSILRNGREIYYDIIPRLFPTRIENIDRFIGVEISFPAVLDEYFQVRNVKRGAEPVKKLKDEIRNILEKPIRAARKQIQATFSNTQHEERKKELDHTKAIDAVTEAEKSSLPGRAGMGVTESEQQVLIADILEDVGVSNNHELANAIKQQIQERPIMLVDSSWPGKELFDITHFNGRAIVKINHRHTFIKEIYNPIKEVANNKTEIESGEIIELARKIETAIDVLFMAYAKAENLHSNPDEVYGDLRTQWGYFTSAYVREALKTL